MEQNRQNYVAPCLKVVCCNLTDVLTGSTEIGKQWKFGDAFGEGGV